VNIHAPIGRQLLPQPNAKAVRKADKARVSLRRSCTIDPLTPRTPSWRPHSFFVPRSSVGRRAGRDGRGGLCVLQEGLPVCRTVVHPNRELSPKVEGLLNVRFGVSQV